MDEEGKPYVHAYIAICNGPSKSGVKQTDWTDERWRYEFRKLEPGPYYITLGNKKIHSWSFPGLERDST